MLGATLKDEQPEDEEEEVATMAGVAGFWMLMVASAYGSLSIQLSIDLTL